MLIFILLVDALVRSTSAAMLMLLGGMGDECLLEVEVATFSIFSRLIRFDNGTSTSSGSSS